MTAWHDSSLMIVKSADPTKLNGASLTKMLNEIDGYTLKSITECNGEIFAFLLNESEHKKTWQKKKDKMIDAYFRDNCTSDSHPPNISIDTTD